MFSDGLGLVYSRQGCRFRKCPRRTRGERDIAATSFSDGVAFVRASSTTRKTASSTIIAMLRLIRRTVRGRSTQQSSTETDRYCYKQPIFFHDGVGFEGIKDGKAIYIDSKGS